MPQVDFPFSAQFPVDLLELIELAPMPSLDAGRKCDVTVQRVQNLLHKHSQFQGELAESALWLLAGDLDRSHEISQRIDTREGAFWHGIMHRREGDFWNAKYWFRKVGNHPVFVQLAEQICQWSDEAAGFTRPENSSSVRKATGSKTLGENASAEGALTDRAASETAWQDVSLDLSDPTKLPSTLVDECERALASQSPQLIQLQRICWLEWQFLFHYGWD